MPLDQLKYFTNYIRVCIALRKHVLHRGDRAYIGQPLSLVTVYVEEGVYRIQLTDVSDLDQVLQVVLEFLVADDFRSVVYFLGHVDQFISDLNVMHPPEQLLGIKRYLPCAAIRSR